MLEKENAYYEAHKIEFHDKYLHKWLVISGDTLFGVYNNVGDATKAALKNYKPGEFMMRRPADDDLVIEVGPIIRTRYANNSKKANPSSEITYTDGNMLKISYA